MKTVLTLGTFDLYHKGHRELLDACVDLADLGPVVVAVNRDDFVVRYKGTRPYQSYWVRRQTLIDQSPADVVVCNVGDEDSSIAISVIDPDVIAVGDDWMDRDYLRQLGVTQAWLDERDIEVIYVPRTTGESSTRLRKRLDTS